MARTKKEASRPTSADLKGLFNVCKVAGEVKSTENFNIAEYAYEVLDSFNTDTEAYCYKRDYPARTGDETSFLCVVNQKGELVDVTPATRINPSLPPESPMTEG